MPDVPIDNMASHSDCVSCWRKRRICSEYNDAAYGLDYIIFAGYLAGYPYEKGTSPTHGAGLDLLFFIVQLGATGPPKYTFWMQK